MGVRQSMLSQRLVKLYALGCSRTETAAVSVLMRESVARVEDNLKVLENGLSSATYGDLTTAAMGGWQAVRRVLEAEAKASELPRLDALAEAMLAQANALVLALESSGLATQAGVVNTAGRQRMPT